MATKTKASKTKVPVNFDGTEGRRQRRFREDDYLVKVKKAEAGKSKEKKTPQVVVTFTFEDGKYKGKTISDAFYLTEGSLWRFRNLLEVCGIPIPKGRKNIDLTKLKGKVLGITVADDEYENKVRSRVADVMTKDELEELKAAEDEGDELDEDEEDEEDEDVEDEDSDDEDEDSDSGDDEEDDDLDLDEDEDEDE